MPKLEKQSKDNSTIQNKRTHFDEIPMQDDNLKSLFRSQTAVQITAFCIIWAIVQWVASGNLDGYHDMLENYAWSQAWDWGTHKHPPFFAWVVGWWFSIFPQTDLSYRFLSYVNVAVGLWGVAALGRRLGLGQMTATAVLLLMWSFPYSTLASKFNANAQLLSLWPWTSAWLLASWQERGTRGYLFSVLLGMGAAISMLSKYYSGLFLLGFLLPTFLTQQGRRWLTSPKPYVALLVFFLVLLPHIVWLMHHDFVTLKYAQDQGGGEVQWMYILKFALSPLFYWLPAWLGCVTACVVALRRQGNPSSWTANFGQLMWRIWMPTGWNDSLFWFALMPWLFSLMCGMAGLVELSTPWAIPIGYVFSLLWLRNLQQTFPSALPQVNLMLRKAFAPALVIVGLVGTLLAWYNAHSGSATYYRPSSEVAQTIASHWAQHHPETQLGWSSGVWAENALLAFYALPHVRTLPSFPDEYPALISPYVNWQAEGGVVICPLGMITPAEPRPPGSTPCEQTAIAWLHQHGKPVLLERIEAQRHGWAFPQPLPFAYAVFEVLPLSR